MPLLEDMPIDERVRRGNVILKSRPRDVEETLLHLINDDDQVVAAAAIDVVREHRCGASPTTSSTCSPIATSSDWYVFEAASWALAEQRMPAERRRELWLEPLPAAELAGAAAHASAVCLDQRRRAVQDGQRRRARCGTNPGRCCCRKGPFPTCIHILLDGRVTASSMTVAPLHDRRAGRARLPSGDGGAGHARVDPHVETAARFGGHARADRRRAAHAARRQHRFASAGCSRRSPKRPTSRRAWCSRPTRCASSSSWQQAG